MPVKQDREYRAMMTLNSNHKERRFDSEYEVQGYATTFNEPYEMYESDGVTYKEQIDRGALTGADMSDIIMQYDHNGKVMARMSNGTLIVEPDNHGIFIAADLSKSPAARDLYEEIKSGLVRQMSWAFTVNDDEYDRATHTRTIRKIKKIYDVSAVSIPANPYTNISARAYFDGVIEKERQELLKREEEAKHRQKIKLMLEV